MRQADNYVKVTEAILNYIQRTYTHGSDVKTALEDGVDFDFEKVRPGGKSAGDINVSSLLSEIDKLILQAEVKQFVDRKSKYCDNMNKAFALIIGQCTFGLRGKLEGRKDWNTIKGPIELLDAIK